MHGVPIRHVTVLLTSGIRYGGRVRCRRQMASPVQDPCRTRMARVTCPEPAPMQRVLTPSHTCTSLAAGSSRVQPLRFPRKALSMAWDTKGHPPLASLWSMPAFGKPLHRHALSATLTTSMPSTLGPLPGPRSCQYKAYRASIIVGGPTHLAAASSQTAGMRPRMYLQGVGGGGGESGQWTIGR